MTAIREALERWDAHAKHLAAHADVANDPDLHEDLRELRSWVPRMVVPALAELDALEAVAEAARHIRSSVAACTCLHIEGGQVIECWPCIERKWHKELMAALARLAAVRDGQTR